MFRFHRHYFIVTLIILVVEIAIALWVHDSLIRPYIGDVLAAVLVYCFVSTFLKASPVAIGIGVLLFCYGIETLQYFSLADQLGIQHHPVLRILLGNSFDLQDLGAYTIGIVLVFITEKFICKR